MKRQTVENRQQTVNDTSRHFNDTPRHFAKTATRQANPQVKHGVHDGMTVLTLTPTGMGQ